MKNNQQVGYRSNLRTSQSISDLSHSTNMEMNYRGRDSRGGQRTGWFIIYLLLILLKLYTSIYVLRIGLRSFRLKYDL